MRPNLGTEFFELALALSGTSTCANTPIEAQDQNGKARQAGVNVFTEFAPGFHVQEMDCGRIPSAHLKHLFDQLYQGRIQPVQIVSVMDETFRLGLAIANEEA